jgi:hypothetical protein
MNIVRNVILVSNSKGIKKKCGDDNIPVYLIPEIK